MNQTSSFYDSFLPGEKPNKRHVRIVQWLVQFGIKPVDQVLEIGCGPGSVSGMLGAQLLTGGRLLAIDISPARITRAQKLYANLKHVTFEVADITGSWDPGQVFDVIFLPDVLEHIPREQHFDVFVKLEKWLKPDGFVMIHIPDPLHLEHIRQHQPHKVQPVDQSIWLGELDQLAYSSELYITHAQSYRVWKKVVEYQVICLRKKRWIEKKLNG